MLDIARAARSKAKQSQQLFTWRRQARRRRVTSAAETTPTFAPAVISEPGREEAGKATKREGRRAYRSAATVQVKMKADLREIYGASTRASAEGREDPEAGAAHSPGRN